MKNKIFPIVCIFLLIVSVFTSNVFAFDYKDFNGNDCSASDIPSSIDVSHGFLLKPNGGSWSYLIVALDDFCYAFLSDNGDTVHLYGNFDLYKIKGSSYDYESTKNYNSSVADGSNNVGTLSQFTYSTFTIYTNSTKEKVFFQGPSVLVKIMKTELAEKKTVQEILGVLPLIIVVVVSFLGLRKALQMLSTLLRRA